MVSVFVVGVDFRFFVVYNSCWHSLRAMVRDNCLSFPGGGFDIFEFSGLLLSFSVFDVGSSVVAEFIVGMSSCGL